MTARTRIQTRLRNPHRKFNPKLHPAKDFVNLELSMANRLTTQPTGSQFHIVLVEPEIPPNTGNIARLCAATNSTLHLIEPLGFELSDRTLKRAGMDYWAQVRWFKWASWAAFVAQVSPELRIWFVESNGPQRHSDVAFQPGDYLVFGRETAGLPESLYQTQPERWLRLPMFNPHSRSLNLSNCVAAVLYEALRQTGYPGELPVD